MKYVVDVNGSRHDVVVDDHHATAEGVDDAAWLAPADGTPLRLLHIGDRVVRVLARRGEGRGRYTLDIDGHSYAVDAVDERARAIRDMTAQAAGASGPAPLKAPMPGLIVRINAAVGDRVEAGTGVVVMEAMKMENELRVSVGGTVTAIHMVVGAAVEKGAVLVELAE